VEKSVGGEVSGGESVGGEVSGGESVGGEVSGGESALTVASSTISICSSPCKGPSRWRWLQRNSPCSPQSSSITLSVASPGTPREECGNCGSLSSQKTLSEGRRNTKGKQPVGVIYIHIIRYKDSLWLIS